MSKVMMTMVVLGVDVVERTSSWRLCGGREGRIVVGEAAEAEEGAVAVAEVDGAAFPVDCWGVFEE